MSGLGLAGVNSFFETTSIEYTTHNINRETTTNDNPVAKLVQLSDLHIRDIHWYYNNLADKVNSINPDFIFFTGDIIDNNRNMGLLDKFIGLLNRDITKVAILGNWERWKVDINKLRKVYENHNCELLINQSKAFNVKGSILLITGLDDLFGGSPDFQKAVKNIAYENNHIMLAHCPQHRDFIIDDINLLNKSKHDNIKKLSVSHVFSGHTHGGQVTFLGYAPFLPNGSGRYLKGWYADKKPYLYVSRGIGTSLLPIRFGSRAEVPVFNYYLS